MRILNIFGTRPQYIKVAAMVEALKGHEVVNVDTGQHYDHNMSGGFVEDFKLDIAHVTMDIPELKKIVNDYAPDFVMVYGDTYSSVLGLIASTAKVCHVESGVRCHDYSLIEEINRVVVDHLCAFRMCPTQSGVENLKVEGLDGHLVGDVMCDILLRYQSKLRKLDDDYIFMTLHRPLNVESERRLRKIMGALDIEKKVIFAAHPRTVKRIKEYGLELPENIVPIAPVGYLDSLSHIKYADCVITDSGGMEKETYMLETPCVTLLRNTPWGETVEDGWNSLVEPEGLREAVENIAPGHCNKAHYGKGDAAYKIVKILEENR